MTGIPGMILITVIGYLLGSISSGIILSRLFHGPDLREVGSGSTGASNVLRTMGVKWGIITLLCDFSKAALSCLIAYWIVGTREAAMLAGLACVIGHNWPIFFQLTGGKGVASSIGVMLLTYPAWGAVSIGLCLLIIALTRFISLGSMSMLVVFAILVTVLESGGAWWIILWAWALALMCLYRHHGNIHRLLHGKERKLGEKEKIAK